MAMEFQSVVRMLLQSKEFEKKCMVSLWHKDAGLQVVSQFWDYLLDGSH